MIGTQITVDGRGGRSCRRNPGEVDRWEGTGCFCGYDEACTRSFRAESQREKGALNTRPSNNQRVIFDAGWFSYKSGLFFPQTNSELKEGQSSILELIKEVRFNQARHADWMVICCLRLHVYVDCLRPLAILARAFLTSKLMYQAPMRDG